jgi:thymidylate synthase (FAD)
LKIIKASAEVLGNPDGNQILKNIELAGRVCYKSESKITDDSAKTFVAGILQRGHEAVIEHESVSVRFICDRGVSHEIVRHRIASYCQESTRYCNYSKDGFGNELTFIKPCFWNSGRSPKHFIMEEKWYESLRQAEKSYLELINIGATPQEARSVLPNSLKTEIIVTMNLREWRHFFKLRTAKVAHPQMREVAIDALNQMKKLITVIFDDIEVE